MTWENTMNSSSFGEFAFDLQARQVTHLGERVHLGSRAFDIFASLASRPGEIVTKDEIIKSVWGSTHVDEGALRVHLVALRKAFDDKGATGIIRNVAGKGYVFAASVTRSQPLDTAVQQAQEGNLPWPRRPLVGRDAVLARWAHERHRLATIVGPGGSGKTALAIAIGNLLRLEKKVFYVDLTEARDEGDLLSAVGKALLQHSRTTLTVARIADAVGDDDIMIILDGCEHIVDDVATFAETFVASTGSAMVLATSREPLRSLGERVRYLTGLDLPGNDDAECLEASPALTYFLEEALAAGAEINTADPLTLRLAANIARRLDGLPLALELAAHRVRDLGISGLDAALHEPLAVLRFGRRTAPERHKSLRANLDWSYRSLTLEERDAFCTLASTETTGSRHRRIDDEAMEGLISKSLLKSSSGTHAWFLSEASAQFAAELVAKQGRDNFGMPGMPGRSPHPTPEMGSEPRPS
ncbi:hypothetical protein ELG61_11005 [Rhizobium leguminosarum]|nr:hypothetical protein ELG86_11305 [Rhizobium leguminosarum]TBH02156.1 hypothetical protein ELG70_11270 [Rhizobium leguminosarum]TBH36614.1 hypothetical protein ELG66_12600 [Rhizobium leguminosarum]TBH41816.1 hypothetical protein ELG63_10810 [Rhizobium leguminosarum]TBH66842.1 hypothetical protein ELG61_11005 [Rhizobium leguminosarum]